ncbi:hypothetical protein MRB53_008803 [Persea americana]|uniref:Uncharacterized protein n=1 Tax=Persea americana TaxID=3435 RepID=A0ACC2LND4_PERAE|nr:hypothetical protein MRB53_008803 [Persea americana]
MASSSSLFLMTLTIFITLINPAYGTIKRTNMIQQFVDGHNRARRAVGVPPLKWEPMLARYARVYSNERRGDCALKHSPGYGFGENIFMGEGHRWTAKDAVDGWVAEKQFYHYNNNSCSGGECLHYTQIIWRATKLVGCAKIHCDSGDIFIACEYYPPGNYVGDRPY